MPRGVKGAAHYKWQGDAIGYHALHTWLARNYPKSGVCENCGSTTKTDWANISGEYRREDRSDWRELCRFCHKHFDYGLPMDHRRRSQVGVRRCLDCSLAATKRYRARKRI